LIEFISVGGATAVEVKEKKDRDKIRSTQPARPPLARQTSQERTVVDRGQCFWRCLT
jgi:hypothetical protein